MDERTILYYEENAEAYCMSVRDSLVAPAVSEFVSLLPPCASILDLGCGGGRDSAHFLSLGYSVSMVDASPAMAAVAERETGRKVRVMDALALDDREEYDGIWAQASLLHLPPEDLAVALLRARNALKAGGTMYVSFRYGDSDGREGERYYTNMDEKRILSFLPEGLFLRSWWKSMDMRKGMDHVWFNAILGKV